MIILSYYNFTIKNKKTIIFLFLISLFFTNNPILFGQSISQLTKITETNRVSFDEFGTAVAIYGDYAVVGVPYGDINPNDDHGTAFVYKRNSNNQWEQIKKLIPSDQEPYLAFGTSVDIYGDYIIVGASYTTTYFGGVYIYKKDQGGTDNWGQIKKIEGGDANFNDFFGDTGISIYGDYIVVGAVSNDYDENDLNFLSYAGAVYIFKKNQGGADNWGQIKKIVPSDRAAGDYFGTSVDIYGDYIIVGANFETEDVSGNNTLSNAGSAYIFKKDQGGADNWGQIKKIVPSDRNTGDQFGEKVSIYDEYIVIGASYEDEDLNGLNNIPQTGSAYIFKKDQGGIDNWGQIKKLTARIREEESYFGSSVSMNENYLIIGEPWSSTDTDDQNVLNASGAAYIFKRDLGGIDNWGLLDKMVQVDRNSNDNFGTSVSINNDFVIVGAVGEDYDSIEANFLSNAGAGYIFQMVPILTTNSISNLYDKSAVSGGAIDSDNNLSISTKGIVWSTSPNPTIALTTKTNTGSGFDSYSATMSPLLPRTLYYVRSYATTSSGGTSYGDEISFTTKETIIIDGNQDGIDDTLQVGVETILNNKTNSYITIEVAHLDTLYEITNLTANESEYNYPFGMYGFKINASTATVKLYFHGYSDLSGYSYRKLLPNGSYFNYNNAVFSTEEILGVQTAVVTLTLIDGEPGDYDGIVNGVIYDPGGPAIFPVSSIDIPILFEFTRFGLISSFVLFGVWWSRKRYFA